MQHTRTRTRSWANLRRSWSRPKSAPLLDEQVELTPRGLVLERCQFGWLETHERWALDWAELRLVFAVKVDLWAWDEVRLVCLTREGEELSISEEARGFRELAASLPAHLPGARPWEAWYPQLSLAPGERATPTVWERPRS